MSANLFMGAQGFGIGAATAGAYYQAKAEKANLKAQADLDELNALLADRQFEQSLARGREEKQMAQLRSAQTKGSQRAAIAANGIDLSSDTAINILTSTDWAGEIDAKNIELNAINTAFGYKTNATNYRNSALMKRAGAKGINPLMAAGTTFIGGATSAATSYYGIQNAGAFSTTNVPSGGGGGRPSPANSFTG